MNKSHSLCNVNCKLDGFTCVYYKPAIKICKSHIDFDSSSLPGSLVKNIVEASHRHVLTDYDKVWWGIAAANHRKYVGMRKDSRIGEK